MGASGCPADVISYSSMIFASARFGNLDRAEAWMQEMLNAGLDANVICYNTLLHACARQGDHIRGVYWMEKMLQSNAKPNVVTYNCLIDASMHSGDRQGAINWLSRMIASGIHPDDITLGTLKWRVAAKEEDDKTSRGSKASIPRWAVTAIIQSFVEAGKTDCAKKWSDIYLKKFGMQDPDVRCKLNETVQAAPTSAWPKATAATGHGPSGQSEPAIYEPVQNASTKAYGAPFKDNMANGATLAKLLSTPQGSVEIVGILSI